MFGASVTVSGVREVGVRVLGIDPGYAVNPDNILAQMQGSAVFMLTAMFWGEITLKDGRVEQSNFHDYRMMRMPEMPKVEVVLAPLWVWLAFNESPGLEAIIGTLKH